jgi:hypothetical protein
MAVAREFLVGENGDTNRVDLLRQGLHVLHCLTPFYNAVYFNEGDDGSILLMI